MNKDSHGCRHREHSRNHHHHGHCGHGQDCCAHGHSHAHGLKAFLAPIVSFVMLILGVLMSMAALPAFVANRWVEFSWYLIAFLPVGFPVVKEAIAGVRRRDYFNEFTLMVIACIGAFCIWELPEAVGVMLFYSIGETLQHGAVDRATRNISRLLDIRGEKATVVRSGVCVDVKPQTVKIGETIEVHPGERVPLDGAIESDDALFDTSALTGESIPREITLGGEVLAGMISLDKTVRIRVVREYEKSALARILELVSDASTRKARTELFIRRFARVYTPIVIVLAALVVAVPAVVGVFFTGFDYIFSEWFYRALVFLVISCPCALVISVPLGYFAGIGAASRAGILFKGGNYLDAIRKIDTVAFDKTGTLTTGKFSVESVSSISIDEVEMLSLLASAEAESSHPLAKALVDYVKSRSIVYKKAESVSEKAGFGVLAVVDGRRVLVGSLKLLQTEEVAYPRQLNSISATIIACAVDDEYCGYVAFADTLKPDAIEAVSELKRLGIDKIVMLSGDRNEIVAKYAEKVGITESHGEMLPQDKAAYVEQMASTPGRGIAFVGDGMNDAPVLALSNVGVAMGGLGSDVAIESADVVIQSDCPSRLAAAIRIGRATHTIVTENIVGAIGIKVVILILSAAGYASLWAAVFADVGVALLAVLNSMRILWRRY